MINKDKQINEKYINLLLIFLSLLLPYISHIYSYFDRTGFKYFSYQNWLILMLLLTTISILFYRRIRSNTISIKINKIMFLIAIGIVIYIHIPFDGLTLERFKVKYIVTGLIIAPIFEELAFRIIPIKLFNWKPIYCILLILITNFLFAAYHFGFPFFDVISYKGFLHFIFGVSMAIIYLKTKRIYVPMLIHGAGNFIGMFTK